MLTLLRRSLYVAASLCLFSLSASAETIIKLNLGSSGPDIELVNSVLSTKDDGDNSVTSPGDQTTDASFENFASNVPGVVDVVDGSFSLDGVALVGAPFVVNQGAFGSVTQQTTGGTFDLFDASGNTLLSGTIKNGLLTGSTNGATSGGFFNLNFGEFTGPAGTTLFELLDPSKSSLSVSLTGIASPGSSGLSVVSNVLQDFTADASANIDAESLNLTLPEPASFGLATMIFVATLGFRRRRV